jgi:hypothetical protein
MPVWLSGLLDDRTKWHEFRSKRHLKSITSRKCFVGHPPLNIGQLCLNKDTKYVFQLPSAVGHRTEVMIPDTTCHAHT